VDPRGTTLRFAKPRVTEVIHLAVRLIFANPLPAVAQGESLYVERCFDINVDDTIEWDAFWAIWRCANRALAPQKLRVKLVGAPRPEVPPVDLPNRRQRRPSKIRVTAEAES
jgi:hypothetical protein